MILYKFVYLTFLLPACLYSYTIDVGYGCFKTEEQSALFNDIIESECFRRLYHVRQYGIDPIVLPEAAYAKEYNRAIHSLGVYFLVKEFNNDDTEAIAALLHDASHTAFSHVGDRIFHHKDGASSYQDDHHLEFLAQTDVVDILERHGLTLNDIHHKQGSFTCLEADIPDMCADRIEYNLTGGIMTGLLTKEEARSILAHLRYQDDRWYFTDPYHAVLLARVSLWHTEHVWGTAISNMISDELAHAVRRALEINVLTLHDVIHGTDDKVWEKLMVADDHTIAKHIRAINDIIRQKNTLQTHKRDNKFRGIDPLIYTGNGYKRLTEIDEEFYNEYKRVKADSY